MSKLNYSTVFMYLLYYKHKSIQPKFSFGSTTTIFQTQCLKQNSMPKATFFWKPSWVSGNGCHRSFLPWLVFHRTSSVPTQWHWPFPIFYYNYLCACIISMSTIQCSDQNPGLNLHYVSVLTPGTQKSRLLCRGYSINICGNHI